MQFVFGGTSGMTATCVVQPIDLVKTRLQLSGEGMKGAPTAGFFKTFAGVVEREGFFGLYRGLSAGLFRQVTYTTTRLGVFGALRDAMDKMATQPPPFYLKVAAGLTAGAIGAFVGTPAEVALIRMTSDGRLPLDQQRRYKHVFDALIRIVREEGVFTLWRGASPTVGRAMALNAAQLSTYDQAKQFAYNLYKKIVVSSGLVGDHIGAHAVASSVAGFCASAVSLPLDMAKTRVQNMKTVDGKAPYNGMLDCIAKVVKYEGFFALWKGFWPFFFRIGPHTVLTFIFLEQLKGWYVQRKR
eukprot:jgi/Galph1/5181/GphlegSOOS_G3835.1